VYILGISSYSHEASCALLKDGAIVALGEEERFNREKHTSAFPRNAIRSCLDAAGIRLQDVDKITFFWNPLREIRGNVAHMVRYFPMSLGVLTAKSGGGESGPLKRVYEMYRVGHALQREFNLPSVPEVQFVEHHLAHAASAFHVSPFEEAAILTVDGRGESTSTLLSRGRGTRIEKLREIVTPHSLGHLYASITDYLGFKPFFDEWKVMGMSAYGSTTFVKDFQEVVRLNDGGGYSLNLEYFSFHLKGSSQWLSPKFYEKFGPPFAKGENFSQRAADIALALQKTVEAAGVHLARHLHSITKSKHLCLTGGVALNCLMNKRILEETAFEDFFIQPIANDAGTSLGSALYYYHHVLGKPRSFVFEHVYWSSSFSNEEIEKVLLEKKVNFKRSENICRDTAAKIREGKIVGWFQGRMECGPRALGNRSIVVDPTRPEMKDRLNARVKRREGFRPFAPSVLEEKAGEYFILPKSQRSPYMILVGDVHQHQRGNLPAVTHADNTARVHTVSRRLNGRYYDLINEFGKLSGVPVLLNTSFNENEPIVRTPEEAVNCFLRTEFDVLSIGDFLVQK
jgi:carbamoyltransferase